MKTILGIDIGIASVGWALLGDKHIINAGVRCFDKTENQEGKPLNLQRRTARLTRNRLHRRVKRLLEIDRLLVKHKLIEEIHFFKHAPNFTDSTWQLRVDGLEKKLGPLELARVIYHICKHRGSHWISKADRIKNEQDSKGEGGKVTKALSANQHLLKEGKFRTIAQMIITKFPDAQRNKKNLYDKSISRVDLHRELKKIFFWQRKFGSTFVSEELEHSILGTGDYKSGLLWLQQPALSGSDLLAMLGRCTFEKEEYRAPRDSFTAQLHT